ncbi:MAG: response regulator transcription factor [Acidobacteria bacterium]|nr:response regulator transcription factor [Acidobacteriota bacterium]
MSKILIVDDDDELCELVSEYLGAEGFETECAHDGESGLKRALTNEHEMMVLDVMLPKMSGFDVLRNLRKESSLPVLMLTARGEETERIVGLEIGADDYLPKPFNPRELLARLKAVLRRTSAEAGAGLPENITVGDLELAPASRSAKLAGDDLPLTSVEFDLLAALMREAGNVVKREDLSEKVLERELSPYDRSLDMHISNLRKKLGQRPNGSDRIKTVRSVGYIYTVV